MPVGFIFNFPDTSFISSAGNASVTSLEEALQVPGATVDWPAGRSFSLPTRCSVIVAVDDDSDNTAPRTSSAAPQCSDLVECLLQSAGNAAEWRSADTFVVWEIMGLYGAKGLEEVTFRDWGLGLGFRD